MSRNTISSASSVDSWRTESDLNTLMEAVKIESDPKRLKAARDLARQKADSMKKVELDATEDLAEKK